MEFTKDMVLGIFYREKLNFDRIKTWTSSIKNFIKHNKFIIFTFILLVSLMIIDFVLVNSFFTLLNVMY